MKKTVSNYKVSIEEIPNREDHYHLKIRAGSGEIDAVLERSSIRHILEQIDSAISTGLKSET
jgi:hypothetical protein